MRTYIDVIAERYRHIEWRQEERDALYARLRSRLGQDSQALLLAVQDADQLLVEENAHQNFKRGLAMGVQLAVQLRQVMPSPCIDCQGHPYFPAEK